MKIMKNILMVVMVLSLFNLVFADVQWTWEDGTLQGWSDWSGWGGDAITMSSSMDIGHTGNRSLKLQWTSAGSTPITFGAPGGCAGQTKATDTAYQVWVYVPSTGHYGQTTTPTLFCQFVAQDQSWSASPGNGNGINITTFDSWTTLSAVTSFAGHTQVALGFNIVNNGGAQPIVAYVDDYAITGSGPEMHTFDSSIEDVSNISGWGNNAVVIVETTADHHTGSGCLDINGTMANGEKFDIGYDSCVSSPPHPFGNPSMDTGVSVWVKSNVPESAGVSLKLTGNTTAWGGVGGDISGTYNTASTWQQLSGASADPNSYFPYAQAVIEFYNGTANTFTGDWLIDDWGTLAGPVPGVGTPVELSNFESIYN